MASGDTQSSLWLDTLEQECGVSIGTAAVAWTARSVCVGVAARLAVALSAHFAADLAADNTSTGFTDLFAGANETRSGATVQFGIAARRPRATATARRRLNISKFVGRFIFTCASIACGFPHHFESKTACHTLDTHTARPVDLCH